MDFISQIKEEIHCLYAKPEFVILKDKEMKKNKAGE